MIHRLPEVRAMGFDVVYLTPIHPIGATNRKGPNNSLVCSPEDPGCPYSIGSKDGGHKAIHPDLGTLEDFQRFQKACHELDMEVALDIALSCSPDHPYVREHPEWFFHNEDGTLKFAENPPKKYEDMVHFNFYPENYQEMWDEMVSIFLYWAEQGVRIFRVDNPHTKPVCFWEYCIRKVKDRFPDAILLSEAFTHPKMMKFLAKAGFSQSYTYFTWRNSKWELTTYLRELCHGEMAEYFRPNFFANTPDILPEYLQKGGRNAFKIRLTLASMLSGAYGIYNGFELCENTPIPGREEYINSEKYQYKVWDWDRPGNIKLYIKAMNRIRNENPALRTNGTLEFVESQNDRILAFFKSTPDHSNIVLVVVNLDPYQTQDSFLLVPHHLWGIGADENFTVMDQLSGQTFIWKGGTNYVKLNPHLEPVHVFRVTKWKHYTQESL
jgi:starch synthase (maltosyl-transferring)